MTVSQIKDAKEEPDAIVSEIPEEEISPHDHLSLISSNYAYDNAQTDVDEVSITNNNAVVIFEDNKSISDPGQKVINNLDKKLII